MIAVSVVVAKFFEAVVYTSTVVRVSGSLSSHRYIKQLFLVLGIRLAQFGRYCSVVKCVLDGPLDKHI